MVVDPPDVVPGQGEAVEAGHVLPDVARRAGQEVPRQVQAGQAGQAGQRGRGDGGQPVGRGVQMQQVGQVQAWKEDGVHLLPLFWPIPFSRCLLFSAL